MAIASKSILMGRLSRLLASSDRTTLAKDISRWRNSGFEGDWLINAVWQPGDPPIRTRSERLKFLCWGSPAARFILNYLKKNTLKKKKKLLDCEAMGVSTRFFEIVLRYAYVNAWVMHADLPQRERTILAKEFNDSFSSLTVLIQLLRRRFGWAKLAKSLS
jgi:hypothetical protein